MLDIWSFLSTADVKMETPALELMRGPAGVYGMDSSYLFYACVKANHIKAEFRHSCQKEVNWKEE